MCERGSCGYSERMSAQAQARDEAAQRFETRARTIKACAIVDLLLTRGCRDADTIRALTEQDRRAIERDAGVRSPASPLCWETVIVLLDHALHSVAGAVPLDLY